MHRCRDRKRYGRGPNRENAQRRKETFWMILTSKTGFYRSRSLSKEKTVVSTGFSDRLEIGKGAYVVDDDWLVG